MTGVIRRIVSVSGLAAGLISAAACSSGYHDLVDPCWPQRYNAIAREEVREPLATQADNGLFLEQTVWNYHFKKDERGMPGAELTEGGKALLARLARRRPTPVTDLYIQTAHDIVYTPGQGQQFAETRNSLDDRRIKAVTDYLAAERPDVAFRVGAHDPSPVGMHANEAMRSVSGVHNSSAGTLTGGGGVSYSQSQSSPTTAGQGQQAGGTPASGGSGNAR